MQDKHKVVSFQYRITWLDTDTTKKYSGFRKDSIIHICGFLVNDDVENDCVTICFRESDSWVYEDICIPKKSIVEGTYKEFIDTTNFPVKDPCSKEDQT